MKPLIMIGTCWRNEPAEVAACRATWAKSDSNVDVRFFFGGKALRPLKADEVLLPVADDYNHHVNKVHEEIKWAHRYGYQRVFKADDDLYLCLDRLVRSGLFQHEYFGSFRPPTTKTHYVQYPHGYMHGGAGYGLGPRAIEAVARAVVDRRSEDGWVANVLVAAGIQGKHDDRLLYTQRVYRDPLPDIPTRSNNIIGSGEFAPQEMLRLHRSLTTLEEVCYQNHR